MTTQKSNPPRRALGARRGGAAQRLHELELHDREILDPASTKTKGEGEKPEPQESTRKQSKDDRSPTSPDRDGTDQPPVDGDNEDGAQGTSTSADDGGEANRPSQPSGALPSRRARQRADFRDALQIQPWTTSQDLWDRYAMLALTIRKDTGQRIATAGLIRAVVEAHFPDPSTKTGVSALARYAENWTEHRARAKATQKAQNLRLPRRIVEGLEAAQIELLEDRGTNVPIGRMISGIAHEYFPSVTEAKYQLGLQ